MDYEELIVPEDIPLETGRPADTSEVVRPGQEVASVAYVDERMAAISNLIQTSMEPAIALMPVSKRKEINAAFQEFESLVDTTAAKEQ